MNICFFEQFGENYDDEQKIFETNALRNPLALAMGSRSAHNTNDRR